MNITVKYGSGNEVKTSIDGSLTVGQALARFRAALGYGASVEGHLGGVPQPEHITLTDGDVLSVHDKACSKAADPTVDVHVNGGAQVKLTYGTGHSITFGFPEGTTLDAALNDQRVRAALGYGQNVEGHIGGVPQPGTTTLRAGDEVSVHDKACSKAH